MPRGGATRVGRVLIVSVFAVAFISLPSVAFADMTMGPGFLRDGGDSGLFQAFLVAALMSAALGLFGLWRMSRKGRRDDAPTGGREAR